jgi:hypothetical protein
VSSTRRDFSDCVTAFDCRELLPELARFMSDDALKALLLWKGRRFERGHEYFDLRDPDRGPFVATGDEGPPTGAPFVDRNQVPEQYWAELITWRQPVSAEQAEAIEMNVQEFGIGREQSAAGEARPLPPETG